MEFNGQIILTQRELFVFVAIAIIFGVMNGFFSSNSIIRRFDQRHRKRVRNIGVIISIIFIAVPIINVDKFVNPQNMIDIPDEFPTNTEGAMEIIMGQGIAGWVFLSLPLIIPLASLGSTHGTGIKYFMRAVSIASIGIFAAIMFTDYMPGQIAITLFISFQVGIIIGGIAGSGITK